MDKTRRNESCPCGSGLKHKKCCLAKYVSQPYMHKVGALAAALSNCEGDIHHIVIRHDDWCDLLNGCGVCNCNPEVEWDTEGEWMKH